MGTSKTIKAIYTSPFTYIVLCLLCGLCGCYGVAFGFGMLLSKTVADHVHSNAYNKLHHTCVELIINMVMLGIGFGISKIYT